MIKVTLDPEATELVARSLAQGGYNPDEVAVRLRLAGGQVRPRFVQSPEPGDIVVESGGVRVFVDPQISQAETVRICVSSEHETLIVVEA